MTLVWNESQFRARVSAALQSARVILENNRRPQFPQDCSHTYIDKYMLAEFLAQTFLASSVNALDAVGVTTSAFSKMKEWAEKRSVTLRLKAEEKCKFLRKVVREVRSDSTSVSKSTVFGTSEHYTVTKVARLVAYLCSLLSGH
jgi:hypothetical protein